MDKTPNLDGVKAWLAGGDWSAPITVMQPVGSYHDIVRAAASGAPAELPPRTVVIDGRRVRVPPHKPRATRAPNRRAVQRAAGNPEETS